MALQDQLGRLQSSWTETLELSNTQDSQEAEKVGFLETDWSKETLDQSVLALEKQRSKEPLQQRTTGAKNHWSKEPLEQRTTGVEKLIRTTGANRRLRVL